MTPEPVLFVLDHTVMGGGDYNSFIQVDTCYASSSYFLLQHVPKPNLAKLLKAFQQSKRNGKLFEDCPAGVIH